MMFKQCVFCINAKYKTILQLKRKHAVGLSKTKLFEECRAFRPINYPIRHYAKNKIVIVSLHCSIILCVFTYVERYILLKARTFSHFQKYNCFLVVSIIFNCNSQLFSNIILLIDGSEYVSFYISFVAYSSYYKNVKN